MPILMSVTKWTQVLSKFYFRDTPEQDQWALRTIGSECDKTGLAVWPGVGGNFSRGPPPQDNSVHGLWGGLSNGIVLPMQAQIYKSLNCWLAIWPLLGVCRSQGSLFRPRVLSHTGVNFWQKFLSQWYIFLPKSLAMDIFLMPPPPPPP